MGWGHFGAWGTDLDSSRQQKGEVGRGRERWEILGQLHHFSRVGLTGRLPATIFLSPHHELGMVLDASETLLKPIVPTSQMGKLRTGEEESLWTGSRGGLACSARHWGDTLPSYGSGPFTDSSKADSWNVPPLTRIRAAYSPGPWPVPRLTGEAR